MLETLNVCICGGTMKLKLILNVKIGNREGFIFSLMMEPESTFETLGCLPKLLFENVQNISFINGVSFECLCLAN
jgi:hypothetical protein